MNPNDPLRVVGLRSADDREGWFSPDSEYVTAVWLPLIGPAAFAVWQLLVEQVQDSAGVLTISLEELAATVGLGSSGGHQSGIARTLRRLQRFGLAWRPTDDLVVVRCRLPLLGDRWLALVHPTVRARHQRLIRTKTDGEPGSST